MKVISISDETHGYIRIAKDYKSAINFLINNGWLQSFSEVYFEDRGFVEVKDAFGENWVEAVMNMDIDDFNDNFVDVFELKEIEVYGT